MTRLRLDELLAISLLCLNIIELVVVIVMAWFLRRRHEREVENQTALLLQMELDAREARHAIKNLTAALGLMEQHRR